jgi:hypothetical protein
MSDLPASKGTTPTAPRTHGLAISALVLGIVSLACSVACLGLVFGPFAVAIGVRSRAQIVASGGTLIGTRLASAAVILGILGFIGSLAWLVFLANQPPPD